MTNKLNNNTYQKNMNMSTIAQLIYKTGGITRADIARRLDLYRSTVTNIVGYLIEAGIVVEAETQESMPQGGRRPIVLKMNKRFGFVAGIDLQPSHYRLTFHDITGALIEKITEDTPSLEWEGLIEFLMGKVFAFNEKTGLPLLGVGFALPGIIDSENGIVKTSIPMKLENYDFRSFFRSRWNVPFLVENDANCSAWHEARKYPEMPSLLTVLADYHEENYKFGDRSGIGIGLGVAIGGEVYRGAHWSAGEFCSTSWKEGGPGQTGFSEEWLSTMIGDRNKTGLWVRDICNSLKTVCSVVDPSAIIFTGAPFEEIDLEEDYIKENAEDFFAVLERYGIELIIDRSHSCVARGAAAMMLQALFDTEHINEDWKEMMTKLSERKDYIV